jgi:hypothetical protein
MARLHATAGKKASRCSIPSGLKGKMVIDSGLSTVAEFHALPTTGFPGHPQPIFLLLPLWAEL